MPENLSIAIVGGGIGGLSLAAGLLHRQEKAENPVHIKVYEAASKFSEIGAGVSFGPNAVKAISLIHPKLYEKYGKIAEKRDIWFEWRRGDKMEIVANNNTPSNVTHKYLSATFSPKGEFCETTVHRAEFLDTLVSILPESSENFACVFGKRLNDYQEINDKVHLSFTDGTTETCDILIAYDGVKSAARTKMYGKGVPNDDTGADPLIYIKPRYTGTYAYRGIFTMDECIAAVGERQAKVGQMYLGQDRHILTFPIQNSTRVNLVAFKTDRSKPVGERVWPPEHLKTQNTGSAENEWVVPVKSSEMKKDFQDWGEGVQRLLDCVQNPSRWALHELIELPCYYEGKVALAGDAAHSSLPHFGAGAGSALEDALLLSNLLSDPRLSTTNVTKVLAAYDQVRRPRASKVQTGSREQGDYYEFAKFNMDQEQELADFLSTSTYWIWNHDIESDSKRALELAYN